MTDRELLEFAAKAAAIELWHEDVFTTGLTRKVSKRGILRWNPLTSDGDALRLAVDLQIDVKHYGDHVVAWFEGGFIGTGRIPYDGQPYLATCRAITVAAAEIGKAMP